jgi:hypothetical protein
MVVARLNSVHQPGSSGCATYSVPQSCGLNRLRDTRRQPHRRTAGPDRTAPVFLTESREITEHSQDIGSGAAEHLQVRSERSRSERPLIRPRGSSTATPMPGSRSADLARVSPYATGAAHFPTTRSAITYHGSSAAVPRRGPVPQPERSRTPAERVQTARQVARYGSARTGSVPS